MASFGTIDTKGKFAHLAGVTGIPEGFKLEPGDKFTWFDIVFFGSWPLLPTAISLQYGTAKALMERRSNAQTPSYEVRVEGIDPIDLFKLVNICIKRFGGETTVIEPEPRQYSLFSGIKGDYQRLREIVAKDVNGLRQRLAEW